MFIFRRQQSTTGTVADLSEETHVMQRIFARPLDLSLSTDRNTTMYESANPMSLLYQPLTLYDDTFILQEYFIPKPFFRQWYDQLKIILQEKYSHIFLLNSTIRFVKKDQTIF
ncbi:unnamed protein product [Rotaria sordida]|uniref:Uncharacterized protein n=1 Tax=Rotaria sordida TaxID=392033 RepID=A0A813YUW8_9BILA|nr:unnamed protein product [Rotaria sordida]